MPALPTPEGAESQNLYGASFDAKPQSDILATHRTDRGAAPNRVFMGKGGNVSSRPKAGVNANRPNSGMGTPIQRARRGKKSK